MIKEYTKFEVGKMSVEVNWNKEVTPCKLIKFTFNGIEQIIEHNELYSLMMLFGNDKEQESLIPVTQTKMHVIERLLKVRAKKDMKEGDVLIFPFKYPVTAEIFNKLKVTHPTEIREIELSPEEVVKDRAESLKGV